MERRQVEAIEAVARRPRLPYLTIDVRPLSPVIGAEVEGLDLRLELTADQTAELRRAYVEHHVLVFRDQSLLEEDHRRIAGLLGFDPEPGRCEVTIPGHDGDAAPEPVMLAESWRADETYRCNPPAGAILHIHKLPRLGAGGDMLFANMHLAHDLLSEPLKDLLADLTAVHVIDAASPVAADADGATAHPVVTRHPATGRPALFVSRRHTSHIVQLDPTHSQATLDMLYRHLETHPVLTCRIRWTPDTVVIWDNRSTQHLTLQDFRPACLSGHVVSLAGDPPASWTG